MSKSNVHYLVPAPRGHKRRSFDEWMKAIDAAIVSMIGMTSDDIDDWSYRADYDFGRTPQQSARRAIRHAGGIG